VSGQLVSVTRVALCSKAAEGIYEMHNSWIIMSIVHVLNMYASYCALNADWAFLAVLGMYNNLYVLHSRTGRDWVVLCHYM
jgi:hypothetical protein